MSHDSERHGPGLRRLRPGIPPGPFPPTQGVALNDEAARYLARRNERIFEGIRARHSSPLPAGPVGEPPPFRRKRLRRYADLLLRKAEALIERKEIVIITNGEPLRVQLHVFTDGTAVFEYEYRAAYGESGGASHIAHGALTQDFIAQRLESALLNSRVRPIANQDI